MEKSTQSLQERIRSYVPIALEIITKYRFTILFVILGGALGFALLSTQSFINVPRDEQRYSDETLKIKYKRIDEEALNSFRQQQQDQNIEVNSNFDPTRSNPFTE
jgi:hypothetical protein